VCRIKAVQDFAIANQSQLDMPPRSRRVKTPEFCSFASPLAQMRAQGTPGARCARSLACNKKSTRVVTTGSPGSPGIPYAMVLTAYIALSLVIGLCCHHRPQEALASQELDVSVETPRPRDFAVRFPRVRRARQKRPPHPTPTFVTMANAPHSGTG
jgi:hypothetical protein